MATISSHTLDSINGSHAGGVGVELLRLDADGGRTLVFASQTDAGGRLSQTVMLTAEQTNCRYELVFDSGAYFATHADGAIEGRIVEDVVVRFRFSTPEAQVHIPMMLAPNSYSVWWSD